jgi:hypothetical protein
MKKAIFIFGPHAVGKMTVGQELAKRTDLRLFHNHMSIEPFLELFKGMPKERAQISDKVRDAVFRLFATSDQEGLIFTYIWYFDDDNHAKEIERLVVMFNKYGTEVYFVELEANKEVRLKRNTTENRLTHKASKRDIDFSVNLIETKESAHRLNSRMGEVKQKNYLRINNTSLEPNEVAEKIIKTFSI